MSRTALYLLFSLFCSTSILSAGGSVDFPTVKKVLQQSPQTWKHLNQVFHFAEVGSATRLGRHWSHLGGARIAPYTIQVTSKADPKIKFDLTVECVTVFYGSNNKPIDEENEKVFSDAVRFSEEFLHVVLAPPVEEGDE